MSGYALILDYAGQSERFEGVDLVLEESLGFFELDSTDRTAAVAVAVREIDIPARLLDGHALSRAVARIVDADGEVVLAGRVSEPRWSRKGAALRFSLLGSPWQDGSTFPARWGQRITVVQPGTTEALASLQLPVPLPQIYQVEVAEDLRGSPAEPPIVTAAGLTLYAQQTTGRAGPVVFGAPGYQDGQTWPATPAYWVDTSEGSQRLQIARHRVAASEVTIYGPCVDGETRGKVAQVTHSESTDGTVIALALIEPLLAPGPQIGIVGWHDGGATGYGFDCLFYDSPGATGVPVSVTWDGTGSVATHLADLLAAVVAAFPTATVVDSYVQAVTESPWPSRPTALISLPTGARIDTIETYESPGDGFLTQVITTGLAGPEVPDAFVPSLTASWSVAWHAGEGLPGGAGDVIAYALAQTSVRTDAARLLSARAELNRYQLAGYVDEVVGVVEWLTGQLAWLPISWVQGRRGIYAWLYDPLPVAVAVLDEDDGFAVSGDLAETTREVARQVRLRYRSRADSSDGSYETTQRTLHASLSDGEEVRLATDLCDEAATAERAAALRQRALFAPHVVVPGLLSRSVWGWLRVGDPVEVRAPSVGVVGVGYLTRIADDARGPLEVAVTVLQDPVLTERLALTGS